MDEKERFVDSFPRLSCDNDHIQMIYDVIVIGSGYGGAVAACRAARATQRVCILEKGREWLPGEFPNSFAKLKKNTHVTKNGNSIFGTTSCLFDVHVGKGVSVLSGIGLGGRSLIDSGVCYEPIKSTFQKPQWPSMLREDITKLFETDADHVNQVLCPKAWPTSPPYVELQKVKCLRQGVQSACEVDVESMGDHIKQLPLWINFQRGANPFGIEQAACIGCGNCLTGCNVGAKNSLNFNYLADAKAHGAHIFTKTEAFSICQDSYTGFWSVEFQRESKGSVTKQIVKAKLVFLAAGVAGSAKILYQSREKGLAVSQKIGQHVVFSGMANGLLKDLTDAAQLQGLDEEESSFHTNFKHTNPGPTTTMAIELSSDQCHDEERVVISELTLPSSLTPVASTALESSEDCLLLNEQDSNAALPPSTLPIYATSGRAPSFGEISFDASNQSVTFNNYQSDLQQETSKLEELSHGLKSRLIKWPKEDVAVYPLGGCVMGETGCDGVVNDRGQVFAGDTADVYEGLYVIDSSIIPSEIHVSPAFTVCMLAERCMRLCAADYSWRIDYDISQNVVTQLASEIDRKKAAGLVFSEKMVGDLTISATKEKCYCDFVLDVKADDVESMIDVDPEHTMTVNGTVTCPGLSKEPLTAAGTLDLLRDSKQQVDGKEMIYSMDLASVEGKNFYFFGIKYVHLDHFGEIGLSDTTTLYVKVHEGKKKTGDVVADGILYIRFKDFAKQLTTISIINSNSVLERWRLELKFVKFFMGQLWHTYCKSAGGKLPNPEAAPRKKRPLRLGHKSRQVYKVTTEDKVQLQLTRFQGGKKGPIMLVHGLGVASTLFLVDTVEQNFVEFLVAHEYDVWLFDWRTSLLLPWACNTQHSLDECAKYDFSVAVDKILEVTGEKDVQLVIHCFGAIAVMASLLLGKLEGKVRCILTSQVASTPIGSIANRFKSKSCLSHLIKMSGIEAFTAYVDEKSPWSEKAFNFLTRSFAFLSTKVNQHCSSEICHRITFLYGLLFEHENLNVATHDILHELFGVANVKALLHAALITRKERIVGSNGEDIYLPGYEKRDRMSDQDFRRKMDFLNVPIMFFNGEKNQCWDPRNLIVTYNMVREANPTQDYVRFEAKGYGHLDTFLGKNSHVDIYPKLLDWLEKYADSSNTTGASAENMNSGGRNVDRNPTAKDEPKDSFFKYCCMV